MVSQPLLEEAVISLAALAQRTRLEAFLFLVKAGPLGMPQGALARRLEVPAQTLSFHLKQLASAKLVQAKREGTTIYYSVDFNEARRLMNFLSQSCCIGMDQIPPASKSQTRKRRR